MFVVTERLLGYISLETVKKQEQQSGSQDTFKYEGTKLTAWLFETYGIKPLHVLQSIVCKHGAGIQSSLQSLSLHPLKAWTSNQSPPWVVDVRDNVECDVDDKVFLNQKRVMFLGVENVFVPQIERLCTSLHINNSLPPLRFCDRLWCHPLPCLSVGGETLVWILWRIL
eukprot:m.71736 g.71736  ORF g.71736 m.71736 type:complete len:169 (+) comp11715_c0_seq10:970-1476(+)